MIAEITDGIITAATGLLGQLPSVFSYAVEVLYVDGALTTLGEVVVAAAGFALAWAGLRFIFGFVNRLLNKSRAGR